MKTYSAKVDELNRTWWLIDAENQTLGRLSTIIADLLRGKGKPQYTPHIDSGDFVVVINAEKVKVTGKKYTDKKYMHHTGYLGHLKVISFRDLQQKFPERIIEKTVWGMIPHNSLGRQQLRKMKVYAGANHPHEAQKPVPYQFKSAVEVAQ